MKLKSSYTSKASFYGLFFLVLGLPFVSLSQQDTLKEEKTQITDIYISAGNSSFPVFTMSQENFKDIVPKSTILTGDIMKVNFDNFSGDTAGGFKTPLSNNALYLQAGITLRLRNKEFKNAGPWIKLGLNYFSKSTFLSTGVYKQQTLSNDSAYFVSSIPVTRNVTDRRSVTYEYSCESFNFEGTLIYKLNPTGIFSLFGGPGAMLGMNFNGKAILTESSEKTTVENIMVPGGKEVVYNNSFQRSGSNETFDISPNMSFGLFVNVGIDLRLGNTFDVVRNAHAFVEAKPMFRTYGVKGAGMQSSVLLIINGGLRYEF